MELVIVNKKLLRLKKILILKAVAKQGTIITKRILFGLVILQMKVSGTIMHGRQVLPISSSIKMAIKSLLKRMLGLLFLV